MIKIIVFLSFLAEAGFLGITVDIRSLRHSFYLHFLRKNVTDKFPCHTPVQIAELLAGFHAVLLIAFLMIGSQTFKAARSNPAVVLKSE